jgi:FMN phosphatase YigB (HAD superfamily)
MAHVPDPGREALSGVRLILFNLEGTVCRVRPTVHEVVVACAAGRGVAFDEEAQRAGRRWHRRFWPSEPPEVLHAEADAVWIDRIGQYLHAMGAPDGEVGSLAVSITERLKGDSQPQSYLAEGVKELLWGLRAQGYTLGLFARWQAPLTGVAIELGVVEHFNFTLSAGQVNSQAAIFHHAMALGGGAAPHETLVVTDNYHDDFLGAREIGLHAVLFDEYGLWGEAAEGDFVIRQLADLRKILLSH